MRDFSYLYGISSWEHNADSLHDAEAYGPSVASRDNIAGPYHPDTRVFLPGAGFDNRTVRFCSRDIDSRLSLREKSAVDAWINSGKAYHVMRDHPSHSLFPMSGGMWCANASTFAFLSRKMVQVSTRDEFFQDMNWLNARVWPVAVKDVLQHDSFSCAKYKGSVPFPTQRVRWEHVGSVYVNGKMRESDVDVLRHAKAPLECTPAATGAVATQLDIPTDNTSLVLFLPNFSGSKSGNGAPAYI